MHSFQEFLSFIGGLFGVMCLCTICHTCARRRQLNKKAEFTPENIMPDAPSIKPSAPLESELYLDFSEAEINYEEGQYYSPRCMPTPSAPPAPASYQPSAPPAPIIGVIEDSFTC